MKKTLLFLIVVAPLLVYCQYDFYNGGSEIYTQTGAVVSVQGTFVNDSKATNGIVKNDGIIEVQGDFENRAGATFGVYSDNTSKDRAVKFVGSGTQAIKGVMNTAGSASFYNLVVDKGSSADVVEMQADVAVEGSLVFGASTITTAYNPSGLYTNNNQKGLLKTFTDTAEYVLNILNGNIDAIAGYPSLVMNGTPSTAYILTSGIRGSANGGIQRQITTAMDYDFPIGTVAHGFNAVKINFLSLPDGGGLVKGKFNDGTDNPDGSVGTIAEKCVGCTSANPNPDNTGYNRFFESNPCNNDAAQWLVFENGAITNHGYWSFAAVANDQNYIYSVEVFPNSFSAQGNVTDTWRALKYDGNYGYNPSGANNDWTNYIEEVSNINDLLQYSKNVGSCYTGSGVPGGVYKGLGHFGMGKSKSDNALPVKLLYVKATPVGQSVNIDWATAIEINNRGFEVDRSTEGTNFTKIGWVDGHNNSTVEQVYTFTDNDVTDNTVYYYKLRQVDNDGHSEQSNIVSAEVTGTTVSFTIGELTPNPAGSFSRIMVNSRATDDIGAKVYVYSMSGNMIYNQLYNLNPGDNSIVLDLSSFASGTYSVIIKASGNSYSKMLVVSK